MQDLIDKYVSELFLDDDFIRLKELKKIIDEKYKKEIIAFKTNESLYNDAKKYEKYNIGFEEIKKKFIASKANLYSKAEVKEYFLLERKIEEKINLDIEDVKKSISDSFSKRKCLKK